MKSVMAARENFTKQNKINHQKLFQEIKKLDKLEKSDLRMLETERHRFRSRHKKLEVDLSPLSSNAIDVRMYETHNPGFCYHCTGAIKGRDVCKMEKDYANTYEYVCSMIFTEDEVDVDKILCLHVLTAHSAETENGNGRTLTPKKLLLEKGKKKCFNGAWNNSLPCYVIDIEKEDEDEFPHDIKLHEDPNRWNSEHEALVEFEQKYWQYVEENAEFDKAMLKNVKQTRIAPSGLGKMPIISPHVYSLLGASQELKMKRALANCKSRKKQLRSRTELDTLEEESLSYDDYDDVRSNRIMNGISINNSSIKSMQSSFDHSGIGSTFKYERSITMLKGRHCAASCQGSKDFERTIRSTNFKSINSDDFKTSMNLSLRHRIGSDQSSIQSFLSGTMSPDPDIRKCKKRIYLNSPVKWPECGNRRYKTVLILVNYQIQALVHTVLEVLSQVNPKKLRKIVENAKDPESIRMMLLRPEMQHFTQTLIGQSLISSPESFVVSTSTAVNEIDFRLERVLEKELIASTLELPRTTHLNDLIADIRNRIFNNNEQKTKTQNTIKKDKDCTQSETQQCNAVKVHKRDGTNITDQYQDIFDENVNIQKTTPSNDDVPLSAIYDFKCKETEDSYNLELSAKSNDKFKSNLNVSIDTLNLTETIENQSQSFTMNNKKLNISKHERNNNSVRNTDDSTVDSFDSAKFSKKLSSSKYRSKPWKSMHKSGSLDADRMILQKMTHAQRILVGQMCASLKTKKVNEGKINERTPLPAFITPALPRENIKLLTQGTTYLVENKNETEHVANDSTVHKLTGPILAKIRQKVADTETRQRLKHFLKNKI